MFITDKPLRIALTITLNIKKNTSLLSVLCKSYWDNPFIQGYCWYIAERGSI